MNTIMCPLSNYRPVLYSLFYLHLKRINRCVSYFGKCSPREIAFLMGA